LIHGSRYVTTTTPAADNRGRPLLPGGYAVTTSRAFPGSPNQVACVREFVRLALGAVPVLDEAVLLASELATNAVVHTASGDDGTFDVAIRRYPSAVRIEVSDAGSCRTPVPRSQDFLAEEGRGLELVNLVADRWGHSGDQGGRSVFFELCW
jgi:anti-sigma regulatory factor (Ser/Thr protein kinase)